MSTSESDPDHLYVLKKKRCVIFIEQVEFWVTISTVCRRRKKTTNINVVFLALGSNTYNVFWGISMFPSVSRSLVSNLNLFGED